MTRQSEPWAAEPMWTWGGLLSLLHSTWVNSCKAMGWKDVVGTSLVVQWLRICLLMQGTWVWSLARKSQFSSLLQEEPILTPCWNCLIIPHAAEQLSPWTTTTHTQSSKRDSTAMRSLQNATGEQHLLAATGESPCAAMTQRSHWISKIKVF